MEFRFSTVNFNGTWQIGKNYTTIKPDDGARIVVKKLIYHPSKNESKSFIKSEMAKVCSGWCYDEYQKHQYRAIKNHTQGVYELYMPVEGEPAEIEVSPANSTDGIVENIGANLNEKEFSDKRNIVEYVFSVSDVMKLPKERVKELVQTYFPQLNINS